MKTLAPFLLAAALPMLAACGRNDSAPQAPASVEPTTVLGRTVARAMEEARRKLHEEDLSLNGQYELNIGHVRLRHKGGSTLPPARITAQGDLVVDGKTVTTGPEDRALALEYRQAVIEIAEVGMDMGVLGADLGMRAASEAIGGLLSGKSDEVEARIEAEARKLEAEAIQLCDRLPRMLAAQEALAAARPEFAPYGQLTAEDIEDCREDAERDIANSIAEDADADGVPIRPEHPRRKRNRTLDPAAEADAAAEAVQAAGAEATGPAADSDPTR